MAVPPSVSPSWVHPVMLALLVPRLHRQAAAQAAKDSLAAAEGQLADATKRLAEATDKLAKAEGETAALKKAAQVGCPGEGAWLGRRCHVCTLCGGPTPGGLQATRERGQLIQLTLPLPPACRRPRRRRRRPAARRAAAPASTPRARAP